MEKKDNIQKTETTTKKVRYDFTGNPFKSNKETEANKIAEGSRYQYNKEMNDVSLNAEELDRIDDFDHLKISVEGYRRNDGCEYGIKEEPGIHINGNVILSHQRRAAKRFLQRLRGFGLLADVVGAGKTYEAGVVLSELCARNLVRSLLVVVPEHLIDHWKYTLEVKFGLGVGNIYVSKKGELGELDKEGTRPIKPLLISLENFSTWDSSFGSYIFDAIIVDEAHNLCLDRSSDESVDYTNALYILSLLMRTKRDNNNGYCLLLSATPHSGNLEKMFKLWYFIRCKGGNPSDFKKTSEKDLSKEYKKERNYYYEIVCRKSKTVMEFIKHVKISEVENDYKNKFEEYLSNAKKLDSYKALGAEELDKKIVYVNQFLETYPETDDGKDINEAISKDIANAYHNAVLRPIMVRQSKKSLQKTKRNMFVKNIYFVSSNKMASGKKDVVDFNGRTITVDYDKLYDYSKVIDPSKEVIYRKNENKPYSIEEYSRLYKPEGYTTQIAMSSLLIDSIIKTVCDDTPINGYRKQGVLSFLNESLKSTSDDIENYLIPYARGTKDAFSLKLEYLYKIFKNHPNEKIVIFFDYETIKYEREFLLAFRNELNRSEYKNRVIYSTDDSSKAIEDRYDKSNNAILVCETEKFTEGINLQSGNVVVNFSITPNPLAMNQRIGRVDRLGQAKEVYIYSLAMLNELEGFALPYLTSIGIMNSNSNDATIISGSSNEKMAAIQCPLCGNVKIIEKERYSLIDKEGSIEDKIQNIYCDCELSHEIEYKGHRYTRMTEINIKNCKCNTCGKVFNRVTKNDNEIENKHFTDGRLCFADVTDKMLLESDESKTFYCSKICALKHCKSFMKYHADCKVLAAYKINPAITEAELMYSHDDLCGACNNKCDLRCRPYYPNHTSKGRELIQECIDCEKGNNCGVLSTVDRHIRPHILTFDDNWVAKCPYCHKGKLEPVEDSTFENFIRNSWKFNGDNGESFIRLMLQELTRVNDIKAILENDDEVNMGEDEDDE